MPANDLYDLIGWLKTNPNTATAGVVTVSSRLMIPVFQRETGTQFAVVPYRGAAPEMQDLAASQIDLTFAGAIWLTLVRSGAIKAYAVTSDTRLAEASDIPTFAEMGLRSLSYSIWYGFFAPKGTPKEIIGRLNAAVVEALADQAVRHRLAELGMEVFPRERQTPEAFGALQKADAEKWWPIIKELGIKAE